MKIVSFVAPMRLFILDDGNAVSVDALQNGRVGAEVELVDGKYVIAGEQACET